MRSLSHHSSPAAQVSLGLGNPQVTGYASDLEIEHQGQRLKWQFEPAA